MDSNQLSAVYIKESGSATRASRFDNKRDLANNRRKND